MTGLDAPFFGAIPAHRGPAAAPISTSRAAVRPARRTRPAGFQALAAHGPVYTATATAHSAVPGQTDDEPFVTADNSTIPAGYSGRIRWLALARDLLARWDGPFAYGDAVRVTGLSTACARCTTR